MDPETRLLTLTGPGGVGKTRLVIHVVDMVRETFGESIVFVQLAPIRDPSLVLSAIGHALGVEDPGEPRVSQLIRAFVADKHFLMILDNFEHVATAASVIAKLLCDCPDLTILATSRAPLRISGEREYPVPALAVPDRSNPAPFDELIRSDALTLFVARARLVKPDFALTGENALAVTEICRRLDGLPLAIELAAAKIKVLSPKAMLPLLDQRLPLLTGGALDLPERHQTMRAAIAWSYELLSPEQQQFLRQVSVFAGGFTLEAAGAVTALAPTATLTLLDLVSTLVDQSLLRPMPIAGDTARYAMLETIREFAEEQLIHCGGADATRERHAMWCMRFTGETAPTFGPVLEAGVVTQTDAEHANIRSALGWAVEAERAGIAVPLASRMSWFWYLAGYTTEGFNWLRRALDLHPADVPNEERMIALLRAGQLAMEIQAPVAASWLEEARAQAREAEDVHFEGEATQLQAILAEDKGDYALAETLFLQAQALLAGPSEWWYRLGADYHLGLVAWGHGRHAEATTRLEKVFEESQAFGDTFLPTGCLFYLTLISCDQGDAERAVSSFARARSMATHSDRSSAWWRDYFAGAVGVATILNDADTATLLLGGIAAVSRDIRVAAHERNFLARCEATALQRLGNDTYLAAWEKGHRMSRTELAAEIDRMLVDAEQTAVSRLSRENRFALTNRELEVLRLLATGRSNEQIGELLFISPRTVQIHMTHLLAKLGLSNRTEAAAFAHTHHLI